MGYKLLGFAVWRGAKWYLHKRFPHAERNLAIGAVGGVLVAAAAVGAQRARSSD